MSNFDESLARHFPGSLPAAEYLDSVRESVAPLGFEPDSTLPLLSVCRDELTSAFASEITHRWGPPFILAGLGGVPALGRTGWNAALSHIPSDAGRGALVVFGFPHIGIETNGAVGVTRRPGQDHSTPTCGALSGIFDAAKAGDTPDEVDVDDYEATKLALRLVEAGEPPSSLVALTVAALEALEVDLWAAIDDSQVWRDHDVAIFCGVQIHAHYGDWIWPRDAWYTAADGERKSFST